MELPSVDLVEFGGLVKLLLNPIWHVA